MPGVRAPAGFYARLFIEVTKPGHGRIISTAMVMAAGLRPTLLIVLFGLHQARARFHRTLTPSRLYT